MNLTEFPISPKRLLIAIGVLTAIVTNYNEFFATDSGMETPVATEPVAAAPTHSQPPLVAPSPIERLKDLAELGHVKDQLTLAVKYSTGDESREGSGRSFPLVSNGGARW